ncbi:MAG TPA: glycosyltransferase family 2 protein [Methanoregulaceae archaeon]|nr:glycosyltransferase family 2 protein [Methanoregulaceae archaeon]
MNPAEESAMCEKHPYLSVVIPFYNEEESVESVCAEVNGALSCFNDLGWELIMVDDGSSDDTARIIDRLSSTNRTFRALHLNPNSGQSAALNAGFMAARGEIIATLDGDGQNDPRDITILLEEMSRRGVHMMCGIRQKRSDGIVRRVSSRVANRVRSAVLKDDITDIGCSMRVFRHECLTGVHLFRNSHRFFPTLVRMAGFSVSEMPVNHRARRHGMSKYGGGINSRLWAGIVDLAGVYWMRKRAFSHTVTERHEA